MNQIQEHNKIVAYESTHNVEDYIVDGWHVWPLLRTTICMHWLPSSHPSEVLASASWVRRYFGSASLIGEHLVPLRRRFAYLKAVFKRCRNNNYPADVVFLTHSERRVFVDGFFFDTYADPFVDMLRELGFSSLVWEQEGGHHPQYSESVKIMNRLNAEAILPPRNPKEPDWFADYKTLVGDFIGREIAWVEIAQMIVAVTNRSIVFDRWLREINARFLVTAQVDFRQPFTRPI